MWNKHERDGEIDQAKGKVKQAVGTATGNDDVKAEGQIDETVGKVESAVGRVRRKTKKATAAAVAGMLISLVMPGEARSQTALVDPVISSVAPQVPLRSDSAQMLTISGINFSAGLSLNVVAPDGRKVNYAGQAIQARRQTSFQVAVLLATAGAYTLTVTNPDGSTSAPYALNVRQAAARPRIDRVLPDRVMKDSQPQVLKVSGDRFVLGLSVSLTDPIGTVYLIKGPAIAAVTTTSFDMSVTLEMTGDYTIMVTNPSGESSNSVTLTVVMRQAPTLR